MRQMILPAGGIVVICRRLLVPSLCFLMMLSVQARANDGEQYETAEYVNALINQDSPYLLQHAHNPVNWYPWGEEAFRLAREQNKPVFLSIGYASCHWCHVMAKESFEDKEIAEFLNRHFISVKVDREQRPDIDEIYLTATRVVKGYAGWPATVFLDLEKRPFYAATYLPPRSVDARPGLLDVLQAIAEKWRRQPEQVSKYAERITALTREQLLQKQSETETNIKSLSQQELVARVFSVLYEQFDFEHGGLGEAPKFPPTNLLAFLQSQLGAGNVFATDAAEMLRLTLYGMAQGGLYDQLAGGFHRYTMDAEWLRPHFEKMLYSQALLTQAYVQYYARYTDAVIKKVIVDTLAFVRHALLADNGLFYSSLSADSLLTDAEANEMAEGAYYRWTDKTLQSVLSEAEYDFAVQYFGLDEQICDEPSGTGCYVLAVAEAFRNHQLDTSQKQRLQSIKHKLLAVRSTRQAPHQDTKILASWNAMMITSFVQAARVFEQDEPERAKAYFEQAAQSLDALLNHLYSIQQAHLYHQYRTEGIQIPAGLEDYAWVISALIAMQEYQPQEKWRHWIERLLQEQANNFLDKAAGSYFSYNENGDLLFRSRTIRDAATPAANAIVASNFLRLARLETDKNRKKQLQQQARQIRQAFLAELFADPVASLRLLSLCFEETCSRKIE